MTGPDDPTQPTSRATSSDIPTRIGPYSIQRRIDSGGMGDVYEGLQESPRRSVAIKVLRAGSVSAEALRRFAYESQILARLRHPGIAQVYEAGTHGEGDAAIPYFAMEYIPNAKPLTAYAQGKKLSIHERLELFARVCDAVHHGHQKGIVHRDLKPANILVDGQGNPRVIDFGIARATDSDMALATVRTEVGQLIGSVQYMSPEQFEADPNDIDTRSDVYTLGVILYELLTDTRPYDLTDTSVYEAARIVREDAPARLGTHQAKLRGDIETMVHKAMEKDRDRRYQSAFGMAEDVRRCLRGDAILARPPSLAYQFQVFARRNKALLGASTALLLALVAGGATSTALYFQAREERNRAEAQTAKARATGDFLQDMIQEAIPMGYGEESATMADLLALSDRRSKETFADEPEAEAAVCRTLGWGYLNLIDVGEAHRQLKRAFDLRRETLGKTDPETMQSQRDLATISLIVGQGEQSAALLQELATIHASQLGPDHLTTLETRYERAVTLSGASLVAQAAEEASAVNADAHRALGDAHELTLYTDIFLASLQLIQGDATGSEERGRELLRTSRQTFGDDHDVTRTARSLLAATLITQGKNSESAQLYNNRNAPRDLGITDAFQGAFTPGSPDVQILVFWESWCPFSQRAVPQLEDLFQLHREQDLEVVGLTQVNRTATEESVREFILERHLSFPVLRTDGQLNRYYGQSGTPFIAILKDGVLVWESYWDLGKVIPPSMVQGLLAESR